MRYKKKRYYKKSTNVIRMKFQSFMDIHTTADEMQIISVNAGGKEILNRLPAFFSAYKYYKIGNIAVKLVPASTLPVDPTGLSYEVGEVTTVDPRDQLTPGMMRITNGEDVFEDITGMTAENQHRLYNSMMLDPRWFKWMLQRGVKRHATPRYWQIGQLHQDKWPGSTINVPTVLMDSGSPVSMVGTSNRQLFDVDTASSNPNLTSIRNAFTAGSSSELGLFQTGHRGVLGWLPTDGLQNVTGVEFPMLASPPEIEVMKIILPPAYKTEYYYRMFVTETVYFKEPLVQAIGDSELMFRPLDVFHYQRYGPQAKPDVAYTTTPDGQATGGNYGDN